MKQLPMGLRADPTALASRQCLLCAVLGNGQCRCHASSGPFLTPLIRTRDCYDQTRGLMFGNSKENQPRFYRNR